MIPSDPNREVIDPRLLVRERGRDALAELVARESGYIFQLRPLKDLCQALKSGMPLLAEGERRMTEPRDDVALSADQVLGQDLVLVELQSVGLQREHQQPRQQSEQE